MRFIGEKILKKIVGLTFILLFVPYGAFAQQVSLKTICSELMEGPPPQDEHVELLMTSFGSLTLDVNTVDLKVADTSFLKNISNQFFPAARDQYFIRYDDLAPPYATVSDSRKGYQGQPTNRVVAFYNGQIYAVVKAIYKRKLPGTGKLQVTAYTADDEIVVIDSTHELMKAQGGITRRKVNFKNLEITKTQERTSGKNLIELVIPASESSPKIELGKFWYTMESKGKTIYDPTIKINQAVSGNRLGELLYRVASLAEPKAIRIAQRLYWTNLDLVLKKMIHLLRGHSRFVKPNSMDLLVKQFRDCCSKIGVRAVDAALNIALWEAPSVKYAELAGFEELYMAGIDADSKTLSAFVWQALPGHGFSK